MNEIGIKTKYLRRVMRILGKDINSGNVRILLEADEDVWHLFNVLTVGDLVTASTTRREEKQADKLRAERAEKKRMTLGIRMEKIEFSEDEIRLRVLGTIETGPQDIGQHHTLLFETGDDLLITKTKWKDSQLDRLDRAVRDSRKPKILFISLDQDDATIAVLRQFGLKEVASIRSMRSGKQYEEKTKEDSYHSEIISKIEPLVSENMPIVLLGTGFEKESLAEELKRRGYKGMHVHHTGQSGMAGVNEVIKTGMGAGILRESSVGIEMEAVEKLMGEIGKDGLAAYGPEEIRDSAAAGAVDTLLVLDSALREKDLDDLIRTVEAQQGRVLVVSGQHDAGKELSALGGMGALLRYKR
ncbi:MAG: mRNA surveillance protein pelota [Methanomassiliicoccaceae archaeon]|nr:mRNA surveillance protein pelota [Methanomassiliicoccaceae archaeon]